MTSPDEWWACGRCGRVNLVVVLQCSSSSERPLRDADRRRWSRDLWGLVERHGHDRRSVQAGLGDVRRILKTQLPSERAARMRVGVIRLGVSVAAGSGAPAVRTGPPHHVVGRTGQEFRMGGGRLPFLHEGLGFTAADQQLAVSRCPGDFWLVIPGTVGID